MIPPPAPSGYNWLASGGSYWLIGLAWLLSAVFFSAFGMRSAKAANSENDGCLLIICCTLLSFTGGGVGLYLGLLLLHFPMFVLTSIIGCVLFPAAGSMLLLPRLKR